MVFLLQARKPGVEILVSEGFGNVESSILQIESSAVSLLTEAIYVAGLILISKALRRL